METSKYLPIGSNIAEKYEIVDILGDDEFEILYLVRDSQRKGSFFVLKELFLETFSSRRIQSVYTLPEAKGVFNKRKQQIIEELEAQKLKLSDIRVYGYEEDNNTIYTIMEFSNNASLEKYLQFTPKDTMHLPTLAELVRKENKTSKNFSFFLKIFLFIVIVLGMAFYAYTFFRESSLEKELAELGSLRSKASLELQERILSKNIDLEKNIELNRIIKKIEPQAEIIREKEISDKVEDNISIPLDILTKSSIELIEENRIEENNENLTLKNDKNIIIIPLVVKEEPIEIPKDDINEKLVTKNAINSFLSTYISTSAIGSVSDTLVYYDVVVKKYFKTKNATHKIIRKKQEQYNKKWTKRNFEIIDFEIIKTYKKNNINYYDIKTTTIWKVGNKRGKKLSGKSRGFMILKEVRNGFKIISIYGIPKSKL